MAKRTRPLEVPSTDRPADLRDDRTVADPRVDEGRRRLLETARDGRGRRARHDLVALNRPDADAWRRIEQRVEPPSGDETQRMRWLLTARDPLTVVERAWRLSRLHGDPCWLWRRLPHDLVSALEACDREPLAYLRALLEAAHWLSLREGPREGTGQGPGHWLRDVDDLLDEGTRARLAAIAPPRHDALLAVGVALRADEARSTGLLDLAEAGFAHALATVPEREPEISSRIHILASSLDVVRADFEGAARHLNRAGHLLEKAPVPFRAAEILLRLSRVLQHLRRPTDARRLLLEAREHLDDSELVAGRRDDRLRLETVHDLLQLAIATEEYDDAESLRRELDTLSPYVVNDPGIVAECVRLQGRLELDQERLDDAAMILGVAIQGLLEAGLVGTAILALHDLRSAWRHYSSGIALPTDVWTRAAEIHRRFTDPRVLAHLTPSQRGDVEAFSRWLGLAARHLPTASSVAVH
ncbi:MAG: hypothetical protein AAGC60_05620 [Acidobacteriota bacterium]